MKGGAGDVSSMMRMNVHLFYKNECVHYYYNSKYCPCKTPGPVYGIILKEICYSRVG